jgi:hypothetical protein
VDSSERQALLRGTSSVYALNKTLELPFGSGKTRMVTLWLSKGRIAAFNGSGSQGRLAFVGMRGGEPGRRCAAKVIRARSAREPHTFDPSVKLRCHAGDSHAVQGRRFSEEGFLSNRREEARCWRAPRPAPFSSTTLGQ